jgi:hypothetical protein
LVSSTISSSSYQSPTTTISQPSNHHHILHPSFILFDLIFKLINKKKYHTHYVHLKKKSFVAFAKLKGSIFFIFDFNPSQIILLFFSLSSSKKIVRNSLPL